MFAGRSGISESRPKAAPIKIYSYCSIGFFRIQSPIPVSNAVFAIDRGEITGGVCRNRGGKWGLLFYAGSAIINSTMQGSYIGNTTASQAVKAGSIPVPCSTSLRTVHSPQRFFMLCRKKPSRAFRCGTDLPVCSAMDPGCVTLRFLRSNSEPLS